jgi:hypothetical protein
MAFRAEDFECGWRTQDLLVDHVDDCFPVADAVLVVNLDKLFFSFGFALLHSAGLAAIALGLEGCRAFP